MNTVIRFTAVNRKTGEKKPCWISGCRFADGPEMKVKSVSWSFDREKAASFSLQSAMEIALQYCDTPATLELRNGTLLVAETQELLAKQMELHQAAIANRERFRVDIEELFAMNPALRKVLINGGAL